MIGWTRHAGCYVWATTRIESHCFLKKTWMDAKAICEGYKARLCTVEEVSSDCTRSSGCQADIRYVWTSSLNKASKY